MADPLPIGWVKIEDGSPTAVIAGQGYDRFGVTHWSSPPSK